MSKKTPKAPAPPDPAATAAAQAATNKETATTQAELNMINQVTPFGSLTFTPRGESEAGNPQYTATQTLAPEEQELLDLSRQAGLAFGQTANQQLANVSGALEQPMDIAGLGATPQANEQTRQATRDAILARLDPTIQRDRERLDTRLMSRGLSIEDDAYQEAMRDFDQRTNDLYLAADAQAGNEMARTYGLESDAYNRELQNLMLGRTQPLNELSAMLSGVQVNQPNFVSTPMTGVAPTDLAGMVYGSHNSAMNAYNANLANQQAQTAGLYSLLGSGAMGAGMLWG